MTAWFTTVGPWYNTLFQTTVMTKNAIGLLPFICRTSNVVQAAQRMDLLKYYLNKNCRAKVILITFNQDSI